MHAFFPLSTLQTSSLCRRSLLQPWRKRRGGADAMDWIYQSLRWLRGWLDIRTNALRHCWRLSGHHPFDALLSFTRLLSQLDSDCRRTQPASLWLTINSLQGGEITECDYKSTVVVQRTNSNFESSWFSRLMRQRLGTTFFKKLARLHILLKKDK